MKTSTSFKSGQNAKDIAMWTHASLVTVGSSLRSDLFLLNYIQNLYHKQFLRP